MEIICNKEPMTTHFIDLSQYTDTCNEIPMVLEDDEGPIKSTLSYTLEMVPQVDDNSITIDESAQMKKY